MPGFGLDPLGRPPSASWVMLGFTAALFPLVFRTGRLTRVAGACLIATYGTYVALLLARGR